MKISILSTSPRKASNSLKVARYISSQLPQDGHEISVFNFEDIDIPMIGRASLDISHLTLFQKNLIAVWEPAELVIFVVPEYNWTTSGELINAMHQLGEKEYASLFDNKVFAFVGVSSGRGGRRPCIEVGLLVNKLISFLNVHSVVSPKLFESHETARNLDEGGYSKGNAIYEKGIADFLKYTLEIAKKWHS
ncbi:hypothetical protein DYBT9275_04002 [Dyadobacter sp. CECT 9275]|uniref:NADPH-dependent FMN reductase-like domain-containing protein n=1 Tax=Dyadobacter helix TaxID=2822344 RepID=A0A916N5W9_9BACT|nr:NAD(P)H-dependent oxidoreductase [Dyadobacter sp. CECT 9275]CAG5007243.1 hypothetical protein DYBT9275_04002 [Dyadobacter sp. CECT 9275]